MDVSMSPRQVLITTTVYVLQLFLDSNPPAIQTVETWRCDKYYLNNKNKVVNIINHQNRVQATVVVYVMTLFRSGSGDFTYFHLAHLVSIIPVFIQVIVSPIDSSKSPLHQVWADVVSLLQVVNQVIIVLTSTHSSTHLDWRHRQTGGLVSLRTIWQPQWNLQEDKSADFLLLRGSAGWTNVFSWLRDFTLCFMFTSA